MSFLDVNLYDTLLFNALQSERMSFLSSDMVPRMPLWIVWKLKFKAGEFPHPPHHTKNPPTEFHWHDTCLPPFHHSSLCQSKLNIQVAVLRRLPCLTPDTTLKLFFMSRIDYAVVNCFAVLETVEKPSYRKIYLIYLTINFSLQFMRMYFFVIWSSFKVKVISRVMKFIIVSLLSSVCQIRTYVQQFSSIIW